MLTELTEPGRYQLKGVPWERLRPGQVLDKDTSQRLIGAIMKLHDYEKIGINPDKIESMLWDYRNGFDPEV